MSNNDTPQFDVAKHSFSLTKSFLEQYIGKQPKWGPLGYLTYKRTYSRVTESGATEEFWQTAKRVVEGTFSIQKNHCKKHHLPWDEKKAQRSAQRMFEGMWGFKWLPPGRGLWMMGSDYIQRGGGSGLNNCAFCSTKNIDKDLADPFCFLMDMSMLGVGVGFDTLGAQTENSLYAPDYDTAVFQIPDTREGWVEALRSLLNSYSRPNMDIVEFNYDLIRKAGEPIKGFGGVASGPEPLVEMLEDIRIILDKVSIPNGSGKLSSIDITDIMNLIGRCVVAGNVRRSAELALSDITDVDFIKMKQDTEKLIHHRWASNNSVFCSIGSNYDFAAKNTEVNGEPGYFWLDNAKAYGRMKDPPNWKDRDCVGANPCLTADTWIHTDKGPRQIFELIGKKFNAIVDGKIAPSDDRGFYLTQKDSVVYKLRTDVGLYVRGTENHLFCTSKNGREEWKSIAELSVGDTIAVTNNTNHQYWGSQNSIDFDTGYILGHLLGDGTLKEDKAVLSVWEKDGSGIEGMKNQIIDSIKNLNLKHRSDWSGWSYVPSRKEFRLNSSAISDLAKNYGAHEGEKYGMIDTIERGSSQLCIGFLRGLFDTDGTVGGSQLKGVSIRLSSINQNLMEMVQRSLIRLGIVCKIHTNRSDPGFRKLPDGKGGSKLYFCQAAHELIISNDSVSKFKQIIDFSHTNKKEKLENLLTNYRRKLNKSKFYTTVTSIEKDGIEDVYDVTIPNLHYFDANGIIAHNCQEQSLHDRELCCLVETFPSKHETLEDYLETLKMAYLYAKTVTLVPTHYAPTNAVMMKNRRIGLSQSGIIKSMAKHGFRKHLEWCDVGYDFIQGLDAQYSNWLGIPRSIKTTSVKPSGSVSLLAGEPPGIHYPHSEYYIRRVRLSINSDLTKVLKDAGYPIYPEIGKEDSSLVVEIPVKEEAFEKSKDDVSIWEQVANVVAMQRHWADNQVSVTVTFRKEEAKEIKRILELYEDQLKSISFLPLSEHGYLQAPYETISKEEYELRSSKLKELDLSSKEQGVGTKYCDGDSCTI